MIDGISNPFMRAVDATGNIKKYQIIVGGILLMIVPVSYVVLKLGGAPYSVFIVHICMSFLAFLMRLYLVRKLINYSIMMYWKNVLSRLIVVVTISVVFSLFVRAKMEPSLIRLVAVSLISVSAVLLLSYNIALLPNERALLKNKFKSIIQKKK